MGRGKAARFRTTEFLSIRPSAGCLLQPEGSSIVAVGTMHSSSLSHFTAHSSSLALRCRRLTCDRQAMAPMLRKVVGRLDMLLVGLKHGWGAWEQRLHMLQVCFRRRKECHKHVPGRMTHLAIREHAAERNGRPSRILCADGVCEEDDCCDDHHHTLHTCLCVKQHDTEGQACRSGQHNIRCCISSSSLKRDTSHAGRQTGVEF